MLASEAEGEIKKRVSGATGGAGWGAVDVGDVSGPRRWICPEGVPCQGFSDWGKVARWAAAGDSGTRKGPFWPQPLNTAALPARTSVVTKIFDTFNILRL